MGVADIPVMRNRPFGVSDLTTYYLEMLSREELCAKAGPLGFVASILAGPAPDSNRRLYEKVGGDWHWTDRLNWTDLEWIEYVDRPALRTGIAKVDGRPVGYFELETQADGNVEIVQLGLLPESIGRGFGGPLVTAAIESAWAIAGTRRVWLHTCSQDHDNALENYQRRGFSVYKIVSPG